MQVGGSDDGTVSFSLCFHNIRIYKVLLKCSKCRLLECYFNEFQSGGKLKGVTSFHFGL